MQLCVNGAVVASAEVRAASYQKFSSPSVVGRALNLTLTGGVGCSDGSSCFASCSRTFNSATTVTVVASPSVGSSVSWTATPASGYTFSGWIVSCTGTVSCTVRLGASDNVGAAFAAPGNATPLTTGFHASTAESRTALPQRVAAQVQPRRCRCVQPEQELMPTRLQPPCWTPSATRARSPLQAHELAQPFVRLDQPLVGQPL